MSKNRENINLEIKKGNLERIKKRAEEKNMTVNSYINSLLKNDIEDYEMLREYRKVSK